MVLILLYLYNKMLALMYCILKYFLLIKMKIDLKI